MSEFSFYLAQVFDGIAYGSIYGLFALSLVLLFRSNKLVNFAQAEIATFFVLIAIVVLKKFSYYPTVLIMMILSFLGGVILHFGIMRFVTERKNVLHSNESVLTIGMFSVFNSLSSFLFGDEPQPFPSPFGNKNFNILGAGISAQSIGILCVSLVIMGLLHLVNKKTTLGLLFEAVAENIVAARLRGIRASNILAIAWGLTALIVTVGAMLIAPTLIASPNMLAFIYAYSLIAIVIGGLESPLGAMVGGIIIGVVENLASNIEWIGSEMKFSIVGLLLFLILLIKPRGIWGKAENRRV